MRAMAETSPDKPSRKANRWRKLPRFRPWVQTAFLSVWLAPVAALRTIPGCVFHCYACPLASFACPVGVAAQFSALHMIPLMALGVVVLAAALVGSLVCGWACPFGFVQDLLGRVPARKVRLPGWVGYGRYVVLVGLVVAVPYLWGEGHPLFICRVCPAGALEGGVGQIIYRGLAGETIFWPSLAKWTVLGVFVAASVVTLRPWCRVLCPLGGLLSLFNRVSVFHLRFDRHACTECNTCRSRCAMGVKVEQSANTSGCVRCLECVQCGAIKPAAGPMLGRARDETAASRAEK